MYSIEYSINGTVLHVTTDSFMAILLEWKRACLTTDYFTIKFD